MQQSLSLAGTQPVILIRVWVLEVAGAAQLEGQKGRYEGSQTLELSVVK